MTISNEPESAGPAPESEGAAGPGAATAPLPPSAPKRAGRGLRGWMRHLFLEGPTFREIARDSWFSIDRRTLGFARIMFGFLLLTDLFRRTPDWMDMFADTGVMPAELALSKQGGHGFTLVTAFVTAPELVALWILLFVTYVCVLVGYRTKLAQVLTVFFVASVNGRILLIENGGYVVFNLLAMWTAFLPMGDRFSVDAWRESMRRKRETSAAALNERADLIPEERLAPSVSFAVFAILMQLCAIYFFNVVHKHGNAWHRDSSAAHYVLYVDRMVNPIVGEVRELLPFWSLSLLTKFILGAEAALPFALLSPLGRRWARLVAIVLMNILHLGFGTIFVLGPFAWTLCVFSTLLFGAEDWRDAARTMRRVHRARTVLFDPTSNGALLAARSLARLDRFELLTFEEAPGLATGIAVRGEGERVISGAAAMGAIVAALPLGPLVAWWFRVPPLSLLAGAIVRLFESGRVARFFGVRPAAAEPEETGPSKVRRAGRRGVAVLRELVVFVMFVGAVNQSLVELWCSKEAWNGLIADLNRKPFFKDRGIRLSSQPETTRLLAHKLRYLQGWFMFAPNPIMDDGTIVVDAITVDGRHVDAITGKAPDFDLPNAKSFAYNQIWSDYFNRIRMPGNASYRDAMREYILRYAERTGRPEDEIVSGDVWWIEEQNPRFGDPKHKGYAFRKNKLFSFDRENMTVPPKPGF